MSEARESADVPLMGPWMCTALVVGSMIGTGIFMAPAALAPYGLNSLPAWVLTAGGALLLAHVFATMARAMPGVGGPYAYTHAAFGPFVAFVVVWGYWISIWVGNAAIAVGSVSYLSQVFPVLASSTLASTAAVLALIWSLTLVNLLGVRSGGSVQVVTTVLKLLPMLLVLIVGAALLVNDPSPAVAAVRATEFVPDSISGAAAITLWAVLGFEAATVPNAKVRDPERNVPRATFYGALVAVIACMLASTFVQLLVSPERLAVSNAPMGEALVPVLGPAAGNWIALFVAISGIGCLNGWVLLQGETASALARNGVFPAVFARTNAAGMPAVALLVSSALVSILVLMNSSASMARVFTFMALLSTATTLVLYLTVALSAIRLARAGRLNGVGSIRALTVVAGIGAVYAVWTLYGAGGEACAWGLVLMAAGVPIYLWQRRQSRTAPAMSQPS